MRKITIKLKTGTSQEEAEMLIGAAGNCFKDADIDVIYSDDPTLSVVVREQKVVNVIQCEAQQADHHSPFNPHAMQDGGNYGRD